MGVNDGAGSGSAIVTEGLGVGVADIGAVQPDNAAIAASPKLSAIGAVQVLIFANVPGLT